MMFSKFFISCFFFYSIIFFYLNKIYFLNVYVYKISSNKNLNNHRKKDSLLFCNSLMFPRRGFHSNTVLKEKLTTSPISTDLLVLKYQIRVKKKFLVTNFMKNSSKIWPMSTVGTFVRDLVNLRQLYIYRLSEVYGCNHYLVQTEVHYSILQIDVKILAIDSLLKDNIVSYPMAFRILKEFKNLRSLDDYFFYINRQKKLIDVKVYDKLLSKLFWLCFEPLIDSYAISNSPSFHYNKNVHYACHVIASALSPRPPLKNYKCYEKIFFNVSVKISSFQDACKWLLLNYPIQFCPSHILSLWLHEIKSFDNKSVNLFLGNGKIQTQGTSSHLNIVSSTISFLLNGIENACEPTHKSIIISTNEQSKKKRKKLYTSIVPLFNNILIVCNDYNQAGLVLSKIEKFLHTRGLSINKTQTQEILWVDGSKFDLFGLRFNCCSSISSQKTIPKNAYKLRWNLYVYSHDD